MANFKFDQARAQHLENELKEKVFADVINFLYRRTLELLPRDEHGVPLTDKAEDYSDNKIEQIMAQAKLALGNEDLKNRLWNILQTYLKHVRDKLAVKDALTKPFASGGLGLDAESADNLIRLADNEIGPAETVEIRPPASPYPPISGVGGPAALPISREVEYDLAKSLASQPAGAPLLKTEASLAPLPPAAPPSPPTPTSHPTSHPTPAPAPAQVPSSIPPPPPKPAPASTLPVAPAVKPQPQPKPQPASAPIDKLRRTESGKVKMDDVRSKLPKVFSPVDELRYLTLKNWRNLDQDPSQAAAKIKAKFKALQDEDYGKMVAGVKAWKLSPVNKLYVSVYQDGLNQGKPAAEILRQKLQADPNFLTEAEFEAIIKLNQELKF